MKHRNTLLFSACIFILFSFLQTNAQTVIWAKTYGGVQKDKGRDIGVDSIGNSYVAGFFTDEATFGSITLQALGDTIDEDIFIAKLDVDGNSLWAHSMGNGIDDHGDFPFGFSTNRDGYSAMTGNCKNYLQIDDGTLITGIGENDMYLVLYDTDGNLLWAKVGGGDDIDVGTGVFVSDDGFVYCTGNYVGDCDFYGDTMLIESGGTQHHIYVAKYDFSGTLIWIKTYSSQTNFEARTITGDNVNSIYVGGNFANSVTFDNATFTALGAEDGWIAKFGTGDNFQWAKSFGSSQSNSFECAYTIATDTNDNFYTATVFKQDITFDGNTITTGVDQNIAVAAFDGTGLYKWSNSIVGGTGALFSIFCLGLLAEENVILTGCFAGEATVGGVYPLLPYGSDPTYGDGFYASFSTVDGDAAYAIHVGGDGADAGYGLAGNHTNSGYASGHYKDAGTFGPFSLTSTGGTDIYVIKFKLNNFLGVNGDVQGNLITVSPNPTTNELRVVIPINVTSLKLTDNLGRTIFSQDVSDLSQTFLNLNIFSSGIYHLQLAGDKEVYTAKVLLQK